MKIRVNWGKVVFTQGCFLVYCEWLINTCLEVHIQRPKKNVRLRLSTMNLVHQ